MKRLAPGSHRIHMIDDLFELRTVGTRIHVERAKGSATLIFNPTIFFRSAASGESLLAVTIVNDTHSLQSWNDGVSELLSPPIISLLQDSIIPFSSLQRLKQLPTDFVNI